MNSVIFNTATALRIAPHDLQELVRGQEQSFLNRMTPLVREHSVLLDFEHVERVDAAGIAALLALYAAAHGTGNEFAILNARPHVAEVLTLVGLDRILVSHNAVQNPQSEISLQQSAA
ncbi:MAG TPA: STAS domain-containing protein [Terracidiphilus sp.]|nr:STAS domain-containing protein [Terracidiphilus sp.]